MASEPARKASKTSAAFNVAVQTERAVALPRAGNLAGVVILIYQLRRKTVPKETVKPDGEQSREHLALSLLYESKLNPRKDFAGLDELAESIKSQGVLQPLVVRKNGKGYEIVCGHRRFRAAKLAKLGHVPVVLREFASDEEVLAAQITENCLREDIHPMEEADAYAKLQNAGHSASKIASSVGKAESYIYRRLQLCTLSKEARSIFLAGKIPVGVASVLARMPTHELQDEALHEVLATTHTEAMTTKEVSRYIERSYMLRLAEAPFSRTDAKLLPKAGACTACPKRTGNQPVLFDDVKSKDTCTDPTCFKAKTEANWTRAVERARSRKIRVLTDAEAKKVYRHGSEHVSCASKYVEPKVSHPNDPEGRSWKQLLGKDLPSPVLCRNPRGKPVRLIERKAAIKALDDKGITIGEASAAVQTASATNSKKDKQEEERRKRCQVAMRAAQEVLGQLVERFRERGVGIEVWRHILSLVLNSYTGPARDDDDKRFDAANGALGGQEESDLQAIIADLILWPTSESARFRGERTHELETLAAHYDVDYDTVEKEVKKAMRSKGKRRRSRS